MERFGRRNDAGQIHHRLHCLWLKNRGKTTVQLRIFDHYEKILNFRKIFETLLKSAFFAAQRSTSSDNWNVIYYD